MVRRSSSVTQSAATSEFCSMAEMARHFFLPESTIRYYCRRFSSFFPFEGNGRRRRYRKKSFEILEYILANMPKARTAAALEKMLEEKFEGSFSAAAEPLTLEDLQHKHAEDMARVEKELQVLRQLIISSEHTQQADLEQLRHWMGRFLKHKN